MRQLVSTTTTVVTLSAVLVLGTASALTCSSFQNPHTGGFVDPSTWAVGSGIVLPAQNLGGSALTTDFNWCASSVNKNMPACFSGGYMQCWYESTLLEEGEAAAKKAATTPPSGNQVATTTPTSHHSTIAEALATLECHLVCPDMVISPTMANGRNTVVVTYGSCYTNDNRQGITFQVYINCEEGVEGFQPVGAYSELGLQWSVTLKSGAACGTGITPVPVGPVGPPPATIQPPTPTPMPPNTTGASSDSSTSGSSLAPNNGQEKDEGGLTWGGIFLMIVFIPFAIYLIAATAWNYKGGKRGKELLPHPEFWGSIPGLVKDGIVFTFLGIKGCIQAIQARRSGGSGSEGYSSV